MKKIIRGRDSGKAQELLQFAREEQAIVITQNKRAFQVKADSLGYNDVKIIDFEDLDNEYFNGNKVVIHNADKYLQESFRGYYCLEVIGFTATDE